MKIDNVTGRTEQTEQRKLAAIMFTDMVGYSALAQHDDALALELLEEHRRILRSIFPRFHGAEIKTIGDAFMVEFQSALEAAQCAIEIQRTLAKRNHDVPSERQPITRPPLGSSSLRRSTITFMRSAGMPLLPASQNKMLGLLR